MSINISKATQRISTTTTTIHLDRLGNIQRKKLEVYVTTGRIRGRGLPAQLARIVLRQKHLPYIDEFGRHSSVCYWYNVPLDSPFRDRLRAAYAAAAIDSDSFDPNGYVKAGIARSFIGYAYFPGGIYPRAAEGFSFGHDVPLEDTISIVYTPERLV